MVQVSGEKRGGKKCFSLRKETESEKRRKNNKINAFDN